jgi:DNA-directed RNA polymerase specialized sigma subunit
MRNIFLTQDQIQSFSQPKNRLEPEYEPAFQKWKEHPDDQAAIDEMLKTLHPLIDRHVSAIPGGNQAYLRTQGKILALKSLSRYDPSRASLATYMSQQLMPLRRTSRQQMNLLGVPDRMMLLSGRVRQTETEFEDKHGRLPTMQELADKLHVSRKQIMRLNQSGHAHNTGSYAVPDEEGGVNTPEVRRKLNDEYVDQYVLSGLDDISATIYKHDNALYGKRRISTEALARKLHLSAGAISQRRNKISQLANTAERAIYG